MHQLDKGIAKNAMKPLTIISAEQSHELCHNLLQEHTRRVSQFTF